MENVYDKGQIVTIEMFVQTDTSTSLKAFSQTQKLKKCSEYVFQNQKIDETTEMSKLMNSNFRWTNHFENSLHCILHC